ncbi:uncharacterized protein LOC143695533 [Agelaius phoeniceus]|uniref:uncharacterized protein LOC143695533 n=1 Tax=Agelaius phoeniceus TaxID=39638 RepID=UPI004054DB2F
MPNPFPFFALQKRSRSQLPTPGSSSSSEKKFHQISQHDIDNKPRPIRYPESLYSRGGRAQINPKTLHVSAGQCRHAGQGSGGGRGIPLLLLLLQNERKEINTGCKPRHPRRARSAQPRLPGPAAIPARRGGSAKRLQGSGLPRAPSALPRHAPPQPPASENGAVWQRRRGVCVCVCVPMRTAQVRSPHQVRLLRIARLGRGRQYFKTYLKKKEKTFRLKLLSGWWRKGTGRL